MAKRVKPKLKRETGELVRTLQQRVRGAFPQLDCLADRYQRAKRTTYGMAKRRRQPFSTFKNEICKTFGLPTRLFNAIEKDLAGMVKSSQEKAKFDLGQTEERLEKIAKDLAKLEVKRQDKDLSATQRRKVETQFHRKRESRDHHASCLKSLKIWSEAAYPRLCFGSRRLFTAQHYRDENGYETHDAWLNAWRAARSDQVFVVGSNDEPTGNKTCRAVLAEDGSVTLKLFLGKDHGHLELPDLRLPYGHDVWAEAILAANVEAEISLAWQAETARKAEEMEAGFPADMDAKEREACLKAFGAERAKLRKRQPKTGHGISYRFVKDQRGWRILVTVTKTIGAIHPDFSRGAIGLDLNDQHVSRTCVGPKGVFIDTRDLAMVTKGKSSGQRLAQLHDLAHKLVCEALKAGVPLVIEKLDFSAKKRRLREVGCADAARRLSSFAYSKFAAVLKAHARLHGVCVVEVNPAYTSVIGAALHAVPLGLTVHGSAALVIARRAMTVEEEIPERMRVWCYGRAPRTMERPSSLRRKATVEPLWSGWADLAKAVHAAQAEGKVERRTGTQRRRLGRETVQLRMDYAVPF